MDTNFTSLAPIEARGMAKCFAAYAESASHSEITAIGFNPNSGYVYIALENGIQIGSCMGQDVEFIVFDYETGDEQFCDTYEEAETANK
jgi:hypothetical protein